MEGFDPCTLLDELEQLPELTAAQREKSRNWFHGKGDAFHYHSESLYRMSDGLPGDFLSHGRALPV